MDESSRGRRPLDGITVVSLEQALAVPFATRQLADLGARVLKVERPDGGDFARCYDESVLGQSSYFVWLNRSKESVTLDVKSAAGRELLGKLLAAADVFVQNLGPGAARRLGLSHEVLRERYPDLIVCDLSGYGQDGPWSDRKAYDLLVQAETGLLELTGLPSARARVGVPIADIAAGMYVFSGILGALFRRATTAEVSHVSVALFEALAEWMAAPAYFTQYGGIAPPRAGAEHPTIAPYGPYRTGDGLTVMLAVQNEREWLSFCDVVLGDRSIADDPRFLRNSARVANRAVLNAMVGERLGSFTLADAVALLDRARIANGQVRTVEQFLEHPSLRGRDRWNVVGTPGGEVATLRPPFDIDGVHPRFDPVPALGEHTDRVLAELGASPAEIARLRAAGVV